MATGKTQAGTAYRPQCRALTEEGHQCRNSARGASKYCGAHKGYQPPSVKGLAQRIEGDTWSPKDKLTDRQSTRNADTVPVRKGARDTLLATRHKARKPAKPAKPARPVRKARKAARATPPVAKPAVAPMPPVPPTDTLAQPDAAPADDPGYVATLLSPERDYLVVYEEPDPDGLPTDDNLLLDIDAGQPVSLGEVDLEQRLDLELSNNTNWVGRLGFFLAIFGALLALLACGYFATVYPEEWYDEATGAVSGSAVIPFMALWAVSAFLLMLTGVILTHYGRRIQARGNLSRMRIVEKAFQPRVALGDER